MPAVGEFYREALGETHSRLIRVVGGIQFHVVAGPIFLAVSWGPTLASEAFFWSFSLRASNYASIPSQASNL